MLTVPLDANTALGRFLRKIDRYDDSLIEIAPQISTLCTTLKVDAQIIIGTYQTALHSILDLLVFLTRPDPSLLSPETDIYLAFEADRDKVDLFIQSLENLVLGFRPTISRDSSEGIVFSSPAFDKSQKGEAQEGQSTVRFGIISDILIGEGHEILRQFKRRLQCSINGWALSETTFRFSHLPYYCCSHYLFFNWNPHAFIVADFLRRHPDLPAKLVLYTGAYEEGNITYSNIMDYGLFDFVISRHGHLKGADTWEKVLAAVNSPGRRDELKPIHYLGYGWSAFPFVKPDGWRRCHLLEKLLEHDSSGKVYYWNSETVGLGFYDQIIDLFRATWIKKFRKEGEMWIESLWGEPSYRRRKGMSKSCFVLMPFASPFNEIYEDHIRPCAQAEGFTVMRANDYYTTKMIMTDIWNGINDADILIAELTGRNSNVFYELGVSHCIGKKVILLSQTIDDVPFDLRHLRVCIYEHTPRGAKVLCDYLSKAFVELQQQQEVP